MLVKLFTTPDNLASAAASAIYQATLQPSTTKPDHTRSSKIFISYRRVHVPYAAGRIYDWLERRFGSENIFFDVIDMPPGKDFRKYVRTVISDCAAELVVITPQWVDVRSAFRRRRLMQPEDTGRVEIETALEYDIDVIPLFVGGATTPREGQLPSSIRPLSKRSGLQIRDGSDFRLDIERLIRWLESSIGVD